MRLVRAAPISDERSEASALHLARLRQLDEFKECRQQIDGFDKLVIARRLNAAGQAHHEWHSHRWLEEAVLARDAVLEKLVSVIRAKDNDRVRRRTAGLK